MKTGSLFPKTLAVLLVLGWAALPPARAQAPYRLGCGTNDYYRCLMSTNWLDQVDLDGDTAADFIHISFDVDQVCASMSGEWAMTRYDSTEALFPRDHVQFYIQCSANSFFAYLGTGQRILLDPKPELPGGRYWAWNPPGVVGWLEMFGLGMTHTWESLTVGSTWENKYSQPGLLGDAHPSGLFGLRVAVPERWACSAFTLNDIKNYHGFVPTLSRHTDPVSAFLWSEFTPEMRTMITDMSGNAAVVAPALVGELNRIAEGPLIYDAQRFAGVKLPWPTEALLKENPSGERLVRLNRQLLHAAYPLGLEIRGGWRLGWLRLNLVYPPIQRPDGKTSEVRLAEYDIQPEPDTEILAGVYVQPRLQVRLAGEQVIVSWPADYRVCTLERTTRLDPPNWQPGPPTTTNSVVFDASDAPWYFRLKR